MPQVDRAGAAEGDAAAELSPSHAEEIAQDPQQRHVRRRIDGVGFAVDIQCDHDRSPHTSREMVDIDPSDVLHPAAIRRKQAVAIPVFRREASWPFFYGTIVGTSPPSAPSARPVVAEVKSDER